MMRIAIGGMPNCCCDVTLTCEIAVNDTTLANFTQEDGTWTKPGTAIETTSATGTIIYNTSHPEDVPYGLIVLSAISIPRAGAKLRMLLAWLDSDNYLFQEYENLDPGAVGNFRVRIRLGYRQGGVDTILEECGDKITAAPNTKCGFSGPRLCYNGERLTSAFGGVDVNISGSGMDTPLPEAGLTLGDKVGIEVIDNLGTVEFTGLSFYGDNTETCGLCPGSCACDGVATATSVTVHLLGVVDDDCTTCEATYDDVTFVVDVPLNPPFTPPFNSRSCSLYKSVGDCDPFPANNRLLWTANGAFILFVDGANGRFDFTGTTCDEVLVATGSNSPVTVPRPCDWSACVATLTRDYS